MHRTRKFTMAGVRRVATVSIIVSLPAAWLAAGAARAADEIPRGARLAATCTGCHGTNGSTVGDALPALSGQSKEALLASLRGFKSGERSATVMTQLAKGYTDAELEQIAEFFSAQPASAAAPARAGS